MMLSCILFPSLTHSPLQPDSLPSLVVHGCSSRRPLPLHCCSSLPLHLLTLCALAYRASPVLSSSFVVVSSSHEKVRVRDGARVLDSSASFHDILAHEKGSRERESKQASRHTHDACGQTVEERERDSSRAAVKESGRETGRSLPLSLTLTLSLFLAFCFLRLLSEQHEA